MYEPINLESLSKEIDEAMKVEKTIDPKFELSQSEIKVSDKIDPPTIALKIGNSIVSTFGNILTFIGKAKSRKSFLISIAIAISISMDYVFGLFSSHLPNDKNVVMLFDTEQGK